MCFVLCKLRFVVSVCHCGKINYHYCINSKLVCLLAFVCNVENKFIGENFNNMNIFMLNFNILINSLNQWRCENKVSIVSGVCESLFTLGLDYIMNNWHVYQKNILNKWSVSPYYISTVGKCYLDATYSLK